MLRVIFYHVGKGDMSLVLLPNGEAMMVDCYKAEEVVTGELANGSALYDRIENHILEHREAIARENQSLAPIVANERAKKKKVPIALLAVTHADRDHITGRKELKARFDVGQLIDSGRDYADPSDATKDYLAFRKEMKDAGRYLAIKRARSNIWPNSLALIDALCPNRDIAADEDNNNQCLVLRVQYGGRSFLFTGDSPLDDWVNDRSGILKLHDAKVPTHVLNTSHHGSRTFFTPPGPRPEGQPEYKKEEYDVHALKRIAPRLSFITCSDDEDADHPHPIALECYHEHTNPELSNSGKSHVTLSRDSQHLHYVVCADGWLYMRTSRSRTNSMNSGSASAGPYLEGTVNSPSGYLTKSGIWVSKVPLTSNENISFAVEAKGKWSGPVAFDWWVLNNGHNEHELHREFYTMDSKDRKKESKWSRQLCYEGVHLMQCHASTEDGKEWANWCVLICQQDSLHHAERWLQLFPGCIDASRINRKR